MKKTILIGILSLCLLAAPLSTAEVQASTQTQATTEFVYRTSRKTQIDRGQGIPKTGDTTRAGDWLMALSGSSLILFLLFWLRQKEEEEESMV